ncbi:restriction endonuclease subunit S [Treponema denticola]|uniref:restriction endonuclease subunit S n=1 Tax=Treponema denticola TaxID=158 RepID=UPI0020A4F185|nr:restriction endonuclease subunit S [Treponema denticola]UTC91612.1 restriction endonuclease subunit S [Treponema denticola]
MNTNALRQKILDLAIHGKLVKQDTADESAAILLEKIRAEKEKKIAYGELKRGKNDSYIFLGDDNRHYEKFADGRVKDIENEIPFAVPEGWAWCRLGEIYYHTTGKALKKSNEKGSLKKYITTSNLYWDTFDFSKVRSMYFTDEELDKCTIKKGDLVVCNGGDVGRAAIWNYDHDICYQNHVSRMRPKINGVENRFFLYVLMFYKEQNLLSGKGIGISSLSASDLLSAIVPLPPTNQQRLIVSEIQKIFTQINLLEQNKVDLQTAVKQAKSKILDLAIRGKLVPQDPADEPARVMLEKLRAEKEAKIVAGEIKRGKNDSYIYKNSTDNCYYEKFEGAEEQIEIPFDLPEGWCWQKISSICEINPKNKLDNTLEISFVPMTLIDSEFNNNFTYELQRWETVKSGFSHFADNDIGIAKITPCFENRKSVIFKNLKNKYGAGTTELHILRTNNEYIFNEYVFWFIKTDTFIKEGINNFTGAVGQQRIGKEFIAETLIPIPPLNEQIKICRTINKLMKKLDEISLNIV